MHGIFTTLFRDAGGAFAGGVKEGRAPRGAAPFATLESPPLYDIVRDVNKLSNNVMAQQIFLTLSAPIRSFSRSSAVSNIVERHLRRAGIEAPHWGAHTLRHSRAVHLLQHGFSLEAIGELLGHRHRQSSFIYAKAALDDLRSVALEVTEVLPS